MDEIISYFDLSNKTILVYSGGKGGFDLTFLSNYCKRHNLTGLDNLKYENIKSSFPKGEFGYEGRVTKDNLCRLIGIDGVSDAHSSVNDCLLEWKLFEKIKGESIFMFDGSLYRFNKGYIVPFSYLSKCPAIKDIVQIDLPNIITETKCIFEYKVPKKLLKGVKKFDTNFNGVFIEHELNKRLNVKEQNNYRFLCENKSKLEYLGSLDSRINEVPIYEDSDGILRAVSLEDEELIEETANSSRKIVSSISPVFDFIEKEIFGSERVVSQELCISDDGKTMALCDLSSKSSVLEIKTYPIDDYTMFKKNLPLQLYLESKGRKTYVLSFDIQYHLNSKFERIVDDVVVKVLDIILKL